MTPNLADCHRKSIRIQGWDYRQAAAYFVTLVTNQKACLFGEILGGELQLNPAGSIACKEWARLSARFPSLILDEWVVMPNHVHGILVFTGKSADDAREGAAGSTQGSGCEVNSLRSYTGHNPRPLVAAGSLGAIVRAYKSSVALRYHRAPFSSGVPLWQRNYYEHIIRNDQDLERIRQYIRENPAQWTKDLENPERRPTP